MLFFEKLSDGSVKMTILNYHGITIPKTQILILLFIKNTQKGNLNNLKEPKNYLLKIG